MPGAVESAFKSLFGDPDNVWGNVVVLGEDHSRRRCRFAEASLIAPVRERSADPAGGALVTPGWLLRHVQLSIDDLVPSALDVRQQIEITGGVAALDAHQSLTR